MSTSENNAVRELRLRIIHAIIHGWPSGRTNSVKCVVTAFEQEKWTRLWPEATWHGARKGPPDYQQALNYMGTLRRQGKLEHSNGWWTSIAEPEPVERPMRKRAAEALELQSQGLNTVEIGERLEISTSLANSLVNDPYGDKERERKKMYCPVCGAKKDGSVDWCRKCKTGKLQDLLPPKDFLRFIHRAEREGLEVVFGVTPDAVRVIRIGTARGIVEHKLGSYESWDDAVEKMGLA
jgi:hypothetical protein